VLVRPDLFTTLLTHISVPHRQRDSTSKVTFRPPRNTTQLGGRKRNTPLHNTSAPRNFTLDTSHQTLSCLWPEHTTTFNIEVTHYATKPGC